MIGWLKRLFCNHTWEMIYPYEEDEDDYLRYLMRYKLCRKCGKEK